MIKTKIIKEVG